MTDLRVRDATEADLPAALTIRNRSFGPLGDGGQAWWQRVAQETLGGRMLAVVDGDDRVLATGRIRPYEQVWGGRPVQMGGIAGVYVDPSARGRGVASVLARGLISRMAELGDAVSCLYPTAPTLYRRSGWEFGGEQTRITYAAESLRDLRAVGAGVSVRPAGPDDAARFAELERRHCERLALSGPMPASEQTWRSRLEDDELITYLADDGFVSYTLADEVLTVAHLVGADPATAAALWSVVGSGSSAAPRVRAWVDPRDPVRLSAPGQPELEVRAVPWMLRVVDLAAAVQARGFAAGLTASARLTVTDPEAAGNTGHWQVAVAGGRGKAVRDERPPVPERTTHAVGRNDSAHSASAPAATPAATAQEGLRVGPQGLAALWCGWSVARLRQAGLAEGGGPDNDAALDAIFACQPFLTEYF